MVCRTYITSNGSCFTGNSGACPTRGIQGRSVAKRTTSSNSEEGNAPGPSHFTVASRIYRIISMIAAPRAGPRVFQYHIGYLVCSNLSRTRTRGIVTSAPLGLRLFCSMNHNDFTVSTRTINGAPLCGPCAKGRVPSRAWTRLRQV